MQIKTTLTIALLLMICQWAAAIPVNETAGDFRISFEAKNDINMIASLWNQTGTGGLLNMPEDALFKLKDISMVMAGDTQNNANSGVVVFIMEKAVPTIDIENKITNDTSKSYVKTYNRTIDNHKGIYALQGNGPDDPAMRRLGLYWLDKTADGNASQMVILMTTGPESIAEEMINTTHVERMTK